MLSPLELLIPFIILVLISLPLVNVFRGKTSVKSAKVRMVSHICLFFALVLGTSLLQKHMLQKLQMLRIRWLDLLVRD